MIKKILEVFFWFFLGIFIGRMIYNFNDRKNLKDLEKFICEDYFYNEVLRELEKNEYLFYGKNEENIDKKFFIKRIK